MRAPLFIALMIASSVVLGGCRREPSASSAPDEAAPAASGPSPARRGVRLVAAPASVSDVATLVREERERALAEGRTLVVAVGATWCDPCVRFQEAVARGDLDADFPDLTVLELDLDEHRDALAAAGYASSLVPLFVVPREDGRASERRFEGGVKGDRAVPHLAPRLRRLLQK